MTNVGMPMAGSVAVPMIMDMPMAGSMAMVPDNSVPDVMENPDSMPCMGTQCMEPEMMPEPEMQPPAGMTCYKLPAHGIPEPGDTTPYPVIQGEHYVSFYYTAPWTVPSELVSWRTLYDNRALLHHWLLYTTFGNEMDGTFLPSVGTHIGDDAQLVAGWAVGGNDVDMPEGVGLRMPPPGGGMMLEWHYFNSTGTDQQDSTAVEICLVPAGTMQHTAGMTWLGTELIAIAPGERVDLEGTCFPSRVGATGDEPIHIFTLWPHMHTLGRNMKSVVNRADGTVEEVFNKPFDFNLQITYEAGIDLYPGDSITSTCTFDNASGGPVTFGPSTTQEMCYQFAFSYPAGALDNAAISAVGATNTCF